MILYFLHLSFVKYIPRDIVSMFLNHPKAESLFRPFTYNRELCVMFTGKLIYI
jgi:hypothetical protein